MPTTVFQWVEVLWKQECIFIRLAQKFLNPDIFFSVALKSWIYCITYKYREGSTHTPTDVSSLTFPLIFLRLLHISYFRCSFGHISSLLPPSSCLSDQQASSFTAANVLFFLFSFSFLIGYTNNPSSKLFNLASIVLSLLPAYTSL